LAEWYRFIAAASAELRQELDYMALIGAEPREFGLKVLDHPGQLAITSAGKRRNAEELELSYSGRISETVVFDLCQSSGNLAALESLIERSQIEGSQESDESSGALRFRGVQPETILKYLGSYVTHRDAARVVDPQKIAMFIREQLVHGDDDLVTWDVAVMSRRENPRHQLALCGRLLGCWERTPMRSPHDATLSIRRLVSPTDEWIDFDEAEKTDARRRWQEMCSQSGRQSSASVTLPSGPAIRRARPKTRGLLLVYPICCTDEGMEYGLEAGNEVTGFAVSFPCSETTKQVTYRVNSVFQDAED
jgi:hypothetical protein